MKTALIGFGRFGNLFFRFFKDKFDFVIFDKEKLPSYSVNRLEDFKDLSEYEIIFLSVPISAIEEIAKYLKGKVNKKSLIVEFCSVQTYPLKIVEFCSVQTYPLKILKKYFPENHLLGIHPLFGPDSVKNNLSGHQAIVIKQLKYDSKSQNVIRAFKRKGIKIIELTSTEHDKLMAYTLCLITQYIGRSLGKLNLPQSGIGTKGYFDLIEMIERTNNDTFQLFIDMNRYNPFSTQMRKKVIKEFKNLDDFLMKTLT